MLNRTLQRIQVSVVHGDPVVALGLSTALAQQLDMDVLEPDAHPSADMAGPHIVVADYERGLHLAARRQQGRDGREGREGREGGHGHGRGLPPRVLIVTAHDREHEVRSALEAGVDGYLELGCQLQDLVQGVRHLARGSRYLSAMAAQRIADSMARSTLTEREQQVLDLVARGRSNKSVAQALAISAGTVKAHMKAILSKLDAQTRTEAASIALERGLVGSGAWPN